MFKDNGRLKPADKKDVANIKSKEMLCIGCGTSYILSSIEFASTTCGKCGSALIDKNEYVKYK